MYLGIAKSFGARFRYVPKISLLPTVAHHTTSMEDHSRFSLQAPLKLEWSDLPLLSYSCSHFSLLLLQHRLSGDLVDLIFPLKVGPRGLHGSWSGKTGSIICMLQPCWHRHTTTPAPFNGVHDRWHHSSAIQ